MLAAVDGRDEINTDEDLHQEIGEALVFPVRSDHVVDP